MTFNPDELERLARKCDEGDPWYTSVDLITQSYGSLLPQDRAFIAAANPATILALLSANREMREQVEALTAALKRARRYVADLPIVGDADLAIIDAALTTQRGGV